MGLIGYAPISTIEGVQILDRQLDALNAAGCERIFEDRASGAQAERRGLAACLDFLRRGDVLVVLDLDRLGRLAGALITLIDQLKGRVNGFRALNAPMDTTTPAGRAFLQIQAACAEMERIIIRQRVNEGLAAARARGRKGWAATGDKNRQAVLRLPSHGRQHPLYPRDLQGVGRASAVNALSLPACRRITEDPRP